MPLIIAAVAMVGAKVGMADPPGGSPHDANTGGQEAGSAPQMLSSSTPEAEITWPALLDRVRVMGQLRAATYRDRAEAHLRGATVWHPDPELDLRLGPRIDPRGPKGNALWTPEFELGVGFRFPSLAARSARMDQARAEIDAADAEARQAERDVIRRAGKAFVAALAAQAITHIAAASATDAERLLIAVEARRRADDASRLDVLRAHSEQARSQSEWAAARAEEIRLRFALARWTSTNGSRANDNPDDPEGDRATAIPTPTDSHGDPHLSASDEAPPRAGGDLQALGNIDPTWRRSVEAPELATLRARMDRVAASLREAEASREPEWGLRLAWGMEGQIHIATVGLSLALPSRERAAAEADEARADIAALRLLETWTRARQRVALREAEAVWHLRDAAVAAWQAQANGGWVDEEALLRYAWEAGEIDLFSLIQGQKALREARRDYIVRLRERAEAAFDLHALRGTLP